MQTENLGLRGEVGWHTHGSDDNIDVDIDLALVIEASQPIDQSLSTMILWGLPVGTDFTTSTEPLWEVGSFEYKRGPLSQPEIWNLNQAICQNYGSSDVLFNANGSQFYDIVTPIPAGYVKLGAMQDTSYWSENVQVR